MNPEPIRVVLVREELPGAQKTALAALWLAVVYMIVRPPRRG